MDIHPSLGSNGCFNDAVSWIKILLFRLFATKERAEKLLRRPTWIPGAGRVEENLYCGQEKAKVHVQHLILPDAVIKVSVDAPWIANLEAIHRV